MSVSSPFKDLNDFLAKHSAKNESVDRANVSPTHTRIPDKDLNVYGGSYIIPAEDLPIFYKLYYESVFVKNRKEHLTERQLCNNGPISLDFDFRYNYDVETRQHTKTHVQDLINVIYLELLKEFYTFVENKPFPVFVFEKQKVNRLADKSLTKDGIHIIIGIQMDHVMQVMLREKVLEKIGEIWDLPLINDWPSVLDEGISKGTTNWQLYGSRKPGHQAYELTQYYIITYDSIDGEFMMDERKPTDIDLSKDFNKLSVQYSEHPKFEINPKIKTEYDKRVSGGTKLKKHSSKTKLKLLVNNDDENENNEDDISLEDIKTPEILKQAVDKMLASLQPLEYYIREIHEYTQVLPVKYYEPGSHEKNRLVAFALKHTDDRLFISWVMLRSKANDFDYNTIPDLYNKWKKYFKSRPDGVTQRSIMYWAKQDAFDDYMRVKITTRDYFIEETIKDPNEYNYALALNHMYKDKFVCSSITDQKWWVFHNHRWVQDLGQKLRLSISREFFNVYSELGYKITDQLNNYVQSDGDENNKEIEYLRKKSQDASTISGRMKRTAEKDKIMKEAAAIFYDPDFIKNMDSNKYLMCFNNGVIDFKNKVFRDGYPQDYITKSTNIDYIPYNVISEPDDLQLVEKIITFMEQLFPDKSLNKYMWDHLSSSLIGDNINQTFNIYRGSGSNGKSILTDLMTHTLGEYKATVPVTLVTTDRPGIGGTSSEIMQLKGVRYAVMQEPKKDSKINEGVMKELTGGDPLQARQLYCESETFIPQFDLVLCTNNLFEVNSNDDGTWRRIRIVDFESKFVDADSKETITDENPNQFPKDKKLKENLHKWSPLFASMLVKRAYETQGLVEDCPKVMASSNNYRKGQDHIAAFVSEMIVVKIGKKVAKRELCEQFKIWFQESQGSRKVPKGVELCEYMDIKFGKNKKNEWSGVEILYPEVDEMSEMHGNGSDEH
jgi:P4 family phage/plasmid primase-like protien